MASTDELNAAIDRVRDLLVENGYDEGTANALTNAARPAGNTIVGNLADLQRMGAIQNQGVIPTAPTEPDIETTNMDDAFKLDDHQQAQLDMNAGDQGVQNVVGGGMVRENQGTPGDGGEGTGTAPQAVSDTMTKDQLMAEAQSRNVPVNDSMTKQQIIDAINGVPSNA